MAATSYYQAESNFCFSVSNLFLKNTKQQFPACYHPMTIAYRSKKQFRADDIEYIFESFNEDFERFAMSR